MQRTLRGLTVGPNERTLRARLWAQTYIQTTYKHSLLPNQASGLPPSPPSSPSEAGISSGHPPVEYCPSSSTLGLASKSESVSRGEKKLPNLNASSRGRTCDGGGGGGGARACAVILKVLACALRPAGKKAKQAAADGMRSLLLHCTENTRGMDGQWRNPKTQKPSPKKS